jgi:hypothetical protein
MDAPKDVFLTTIIQLYIIIEVLGSGMMMALIREGKINKSIIYIPLLLLVAFMIYHLSKIVITGIVVGSV